MCKHPSTIEDAPQLNNIAIWSSGGKKMTPKAKMRTFSKKGSSRLKAEPDIMVSSSFD